MRESGQFFTLEGIAASLLLLSTVIFIVSSGSLTPPPTNGQQKSGEEQVVYDALVVLDNTPSQRGGLREAVALWNGTSFKAEYQKLLNCAGLNDYLLSVRVVFHSQQGTESSQLLEEPHGIFSTAALSASRLVVLPDSFRKTASHPSSMRDGKQVVRLEVLLWRA